MDIYIKTDVSFVLNEFALRTFENSGSYNCMCPGMESFLIVLALDLLTECEKHIYNN